MTTKELEALAAQFKLMADELRRLGNSFPLSGCSAVLLAANMSASYADRAAALVEDQIEAVEIAAVAQEELPCTASR